MCVQPGSQIEGILMDDDPSELEPSKGGVVLCVYCRSAQFRGEVVCGMCGEEVFG